jgi:predicted DsbA family dithiol-disulfide isomerase
VVAIVAANKDPDPFMRRAMAGVWEEERNLGDPLVIAELAEAAGLDSTSLLEAARGTLTEAVYALNLENAVAADVSARRPMSSTARCSGARTGSSSSTTR